jgi:hypothetical protein
LQLSKAESFEDWLTSRVGASGAISLSWKHQKSTPSLFMNSKFALTVLIKRILFILYHKKMKTSEYDVYQIWEWRINVLLLLAMLNELVPSSHGQCLVAAPNGSPPVPRNVCQNATLNLNQSYSYMSKFKLKSKCSSNNKKKPLWI